MDYSKKGVKAKQRALHATGEKWGHKIVLLIILAILISIVGAGIIGCAAGIGMFKGILASAPEINSNDVAPVGAATFVYDAKGNKIDELVSTNSNRIMVTMDKIPDELGKAFVALEDERFYQNNGIDIKALARAGFEFLRSKGHTTQGGSTITQQLLKNTIFTEWTSEGNNYAKKIKRKFQEQYLAVQLTKTLDKEEILERYMNTINLGQNTLGVEAASQRYFGKHVEELTLSECAVIAPITQNPSRYNPIRHPEENAKRREKCLKNMKDLGYITPEQWAEALADDVYARIESHNVSYLADSAGSSSYFTDALTEDVKEALMAAGYNETQTEFLVYSGGLRIYSTMDPDIQAICDREVANESNYPPTTHWYLKYSITVKHADGTSNNYSKEMMMKYFKENVNKDFNLIFSSQEAAYDAIERYREHLVGEDDDYVEDISLTPQPQVTVCVMEQDTGYVRAMVGGRGDKEGRMTLNRATSDPRQPGSTFKVLAAYAPGIDAAGITLATVFNDAPFYYDTGTPIKNWWGKAYRGPVTVRYAIEESANIIAVKTLTQITPQLGYDYLQNFGFTTLTTGQRGSDGLIRTDVRQPLALGGITNGVTNEELTAAYATIANHGVYNKPKLFTKVLDSDGNVLLDNTAPISRVVLKESTAYLLTSAMQDVVSKGTGTAVRFPNMDIAGKTGTTSDNVDVWFAGFTPYYTCATWAGYDNHIKMISKGAEQETGISKKLWKSIMSQIHEDLPYAEFEIPESVIPYEICGDSGKLAIEGVCPESSIRTEYFAEDSLPMEDCDVHYVGLVCAYEGKPASSDCPFAVPGVATLSPIEDPALWQGSTVPVEQPDGTYIYVSPNTSNTCQHDINFYLNPDYEAILAQQQAVINSR